MNNNSEKENNNADYMNNDNEVPTVPSTPIPLFLDKHENNIKSENELIMSNKPTTITFQKENVKESDEKTNKQNVWGATFLFANTSLGLTIFTFAIRAKQFGLFWFY